MKWTDDEIDQVFRRFASDQKVVYKDVYWSEMEAILDAGKSSKKRMGWWMFSGIVLLFFGLFSFYFLGVNIKNDGTNVKVNEGVQTRLDVVNTENAIPVSKKETLSPLKFQLQVREYQASLFNDEGVSALLTLSSTEIALMNIHKVDNFYLNAEGYWNLKQGKFGSSQYLYENLLNTRMASNEVEINHVKEYKVGSIVIPPVRSMNTEKVSSDKQSELLTEEQIDEIDVKMKKSDLKQMHHSQEGIMVSTVSEPLLVDKRSGYYVGASFGAASSYLAQSKELATQWLIVMGYDYTFVKNVRLGIGVGFRQQIINDMEIKKQRDYYSLGLVSFNQAIKYDRFNFIDVNVHLHYIYKKFNFGVNVSPTFLIATRATIDQQFKENGASIHVPEAPSIEKKFVESDNFYKVGLNANLSVQYEFKRRFVLNLGVGSRFTPFINSNLFNSEPRNMPLNLELGLIKRF